MIIYDMWWLLLGGGTTQGTPKNPFLPFMFFGSLGIPVIFWWSLGIPGNQTTKRPKPTIP